MPAPWRGAQRSTAPSIQCSCPPPCRRRPAFSVATVPRACPPERRAFGGTALDGVRRCLTTAQMTSFDERIPSPCLCPPAERRAFGGAALDSVRQCSTTSRGRQMTYMVRSVRGHGRSRRRNFCCTFMSNILNIFGVTTRLRGGWSLYKKRVLGFTVKRYPSDLKLLGPKKLD